ncbi:MAG: type II toxin-antitoxin system HicB family antitoxin [Candidatus Hydrogenedentales bacterium]
MKTAASSPFAPALQGCFTEGETLEEAKANIREAIQLSIESRLKEGEPVTKEFGVETVKVAL